MNALAILLAAAVASYLLRILFVGLLPADRLPPVVRRGLTYVGPAATAAIATAALLAGSTTGSGAATHLVALAVAAVVSYRWRNLALVVVAAVAAAWLTQIVVSL